MDKPVLRVRGLSRRYGAKEAIRGVGLEVRAGEIVGLLGPNGAGKTTTLECIVGLRRADAGRIEIEGRGAGASREAVKTRVGAVLQSTALPDQLRVGEALRLFGAFYRPTNDRVGPCLLDRFALREVEGVPFARLSGGQRQRLALALAFLGEPAVLVLDEPTVGLDPAARRSLHASLREAREEGRAVLLSTHLLDEAEQLCDRLVLLDEGRVVATGTLAELRARVGLPARLAFETVPPVPAEALAAIPGAEPPVREENLWTLRTTDPGGSLAALGPLLVAGGYAVRRLETREASLEDVFHALTGRAWPQPEEAA
jgi:ABC-2 type transport system ATP-binding protein